MSIGIHLKDIHKAPQTMINHQKIFVSVLGPLCKQEMCFQERGDMINNFQERQNYNLLRERIYILKLSERQLQTLRRIQEIKKCVRWKTILLQKSFSMNLLEKFQRVKRPFIIARMAWFTIMTPHERQLWTIRRIQAKTKLRILEERRRTSELEEHEI